MPESRGTLDALALQLAGLLKPLDERVGAGDLRGLIAELGLQFPPSIDTDAALITAGETAVRRLRDMPPQIADLVAAIEAEDVPQIVARALQLAGTVAAAVPAIEDVASALESAGAGAGIPAAELQQFADELPRRLIDYVAVRQLEAVPGAAEALELIGAVERTPLPAVDPQHPAYVKRRLDLDALTAFVSSPATHLRTKYGWGDPAFDGSTLLSTLDRLLRSAGVPGVLDSSGPVPVLDIVGLELKARTDLDPRGLSVRIAQPFLIDPAPFVQDDWQVKLVAEAQLLAGAEIVLQSDDTVRFIPPSGTVQGDLLVEWTGGMGGTPYVIVGQPGSSRIEARQLVVNAGVGFGFDSATGQASGDLRIGGEVKGGRLVISFAGADGFLGKLLGGVGVETDFDLGLGYSTREGLHFVGSAELEVQVPLHVVLGPVELRALTLTVGIEGTRFPAGVAVDIKAALGPLQAVVEQVGMELALAVPPDQRGNAGPLDFALGFKPPKGVGLSLDAGVVKGGGYLFIDAERGEYAGALELTFSGVVALKAIGLISTKMPDGRPGFSLLIIITAEFGTGIQLGFGFTLLGVGGLLGLNRTVRMEALAEGVRTGAVESIMFPRDVVANAPKIISDLRTVFPPKEGTFLIGPMAKLGWGTPTLVSLAVGVIIEIPGNIAIVGVLKVALPAEDAPLIVIKVSFAGAIEFDRKRIWFFASLFESRILFITIEGEMGLLVAYGDDANFVVSVGGFHPRFSPPPLPFPSPRRVSVDLVNSPVARVRIEGYLAVTSNTAQFGARAELFFGLDAINVQGDLGFDALFQFSPLHFTIDVSASFSVKVFGAGLFSVRVRGSLEGPAPWRARGEGSISLLFFDISVDFDVTWGEDDGTTLPPIEVMPLVKAELEKDDCWRALPPAGMDLLVSLRKLPEAESDLVLHPVGVLRVSQRKLPLELKLDKVGSQKPSDVERVRLQVAPGGLTKRGDALEQFAPAQYQDLSDADKLSRPAYGRDRGGVELSGAASLTTGRMVRRIVRYEEIILDDNYKRFQRRFFRYNPALFGHFLNGASIAKSALSKAQKDRLQPFAEKIVVHDELFTVAKLADNTAFAVDAIGFASEASAREHLARAVRDDPGLAGSLHVIPEFERAG